MRMGWGQESSVCDRKMSLDGQVVTQPGKCAEEAVRGPVGKRDCGKS